MDLIATSSHIGRMEVEGFPHSLTEALAAMEPITPHRDDDCATLSLTVWISEDGGYVDKVDMARWRFRYIEDRWVLLEYEPYSSSQSVNAELMLFEEQLLAVLASKRHVNAPVYIGDAEKETYASYLVDFPETKEDVLAAYIPSALVEPYKQRARELGYEVIS